MIGEKIHSYEITEHLGRGGMGNVYKATDTMLGRDVALKMLHPQLTMESQFLDRFKKEARVLAQLLHPNIAVIYNFIEQGGNHFMVMEYVEGTNLDDLLKKYKTLPAEFVVPVFIQVLEGLKHAHRKNIFHRDIKPANIMLTPDDTVKLMDFGIAKVAGEQKMTQVNKIVGTVEFMAPELLQGKDASAASDIYAAGVTLYELLCGKLPFVADTDFNLMQAIMKEKVVHPIKCNATVPKALSDIVMKTLDKNPAARFTDAAAFQQALINAFPNYRNINMASLAAASPAYAQGGPATRFEKITNAGMETRVETWAKPLSALENSKAHIVKNKKAYLIGLLLLICLFIVIGIVKNKKTGPEVADTEQPKPQDNDGGVIPPPDVTQGSNPIVDRREPVTEPDKEKVPEKKEPEKAKEKKEEVKSSDKIGFKPAEEEEKKEEKPAPPKDVLIMSKVVIQLYLQNDLGNAPERQDIPVTFSLKNNVEYKGVTIIKQGAVARGVIKLGKVQTDVDINSITAANGQQLNLKAQRGHGRRNEITSNRNYTAIILPGVRLKF